jgi:putative Mg2+ transporter-C (MgtC) family protein
MDLLLASDTSLDIGSTDELVAVGVVVLAALLGALLGFEREAANKSAGARTHMLVAGGSALAVSVGQLLFVSEGSGNGDPARALHAVLTGIGFLCAGAIIRRESGVEGLTTAASLWFAAAVGIAIGLQLYILGVGAALIGLVILRVMAKIEGRVVEAIDAVEPDDD